MSERKIFDKGEVYVNPDDMLMMVRDVSLDENGFKINYITENGETGYFYSDDKEIVDNIELYNQDPKPVNNDALEALENFLNITGLTPKDEVKKTYIDLHRHLPTIREALTREMADLKSMKEDLVMDCCTSEMNVIDIAVKSCINYSIDQIIERHKGKIIK